MRRGCNRADEQEKCDGEFREFHGVFVGVIGRFKVVLGNLLGLLGRLGPSLFIVEGSEAVVSRDLTSVPRSGLARPRDMVASGKNGKNGKNDR
jgi:hypothetical protein